MGSFDVVGERFDWKFDPISRSWQREFTNGNIGRIELIDGDERFYRCDILDENERSFFFTRRETFVEARVFMDLALLDLDD